jgi:predicted alpha/beta hydrolase family esterase
MKNLGKGIIFIIHGYRSGPKDCWFPWLKKELVKHGFEVFIPKMPHASNPKLKEWLSFIEHYIGHISDIIATHNNNNLREYIGHISDIKDIKRYDRYIYLIGHSLGAVAIIRYLEKMALGRKIGGVILVAGRFFQRKTLSKSSNFFVGKPINWKKVKKVGRKFFGIYSVDDPFVSLNNAQILSEKLDASIAIEKNKGHFSMSDSVRKLPIVLNVLLKMHHLNKYNIP